MNRPVSVILALIILVSVPALGGEAVDMRGELEGAPFRIQVPEEWNGNLVMYTHGYLPRGAQWTPLHPSLAVVFLERGFALAESGYSRQGWAVNKRWYCYY